jgi:hypothetical protein
MLFKRYIFNFLILYKNFNLFYAYCGINIISEHSGALPDGESCQGSGPGAAGAAFQGKPTTGFT